MRKLSSSITKATQKGFTLIELVIVIVIIGILAAIAVPQFGTSVADATKAQNQSTLAMVKTAWATAYAVGKTAPTVQGVWDQTIDPASATGAKCTSTSCGQAVIAVTATAGFVPNPSSITCTTGC